MTQLFWIQAVRVDKLLAAKEHTCSACMGIIMKREFYARINWQSHSVTKSRLPIYDTNAMHLDCFSRVFQMPGRNRVEKSRAKKTKQWRGVLADAQEA